MPQEKCIIMIAKGTPKTNFMFPDRFNACIATNSNAEKYKKVSINKIQSAQLNQIEENPNTKMLRMNNGGSACLQRIVWGYLRSI